tara:strand:+ start:382 stop:702 length:321 start_codon:yes stop_codon:yes gene_type:complete
MTDNYKGFPARMSDARFMTNWTPSCLANKIMQGEMNSYDYRMHLMRSAETIFENIKKVNEEKYGCSDCSKVPIPETKSYQDCWGPNCLINKVNPKGIGIDNVTSKN